MHEVYNVGRTLIKTTIELLTLQLATLQASNHHPSSTSIEDGSNSENPFVASPHHQQKIAYRKVVIRWKSRLKVNIPEFKGSLQEKEFLD